jgi:hypothetical protein
MSGVKRAREDLTADSGGEASSSVEAAAKAAHKERDKVVSLVEVQVRSVCFIVMTTMIN